MRTLAPLPADSPVDGVHYRVTGDGEHTVVLLHGFSDNLCTWDRVVPPLAARHRVVAIDLPGFGRSSRPWSRPLLPGYVEVVRAVLDAERITGPVSLMGNSMGAVVSLLFAAAHPDRARAVVLIDMPGLATVPRLWRLAMSRPAEAAVRAGLRVVPPQLTSDGLGWAYAHIAAARPGRLDPAARQSFCSPYALRDSVPALLPLGRALLNELRTARLATLLATLGLPALLVFGSRDVLTPARVLRRLGRPGGAVVLPGCGHCPQLDRPAALLGEVLPFLAEASRSAPAARTA